MFISDYLEKAPLFIMMLIVMLLVFSECAFIFGLFLPGDSMLVTVGSVLSAKNLELNSYIIFMILLILVTFFGNSLGYYFGVKSGKRFLVREGGRFFTEKNINKASDFMDKYGVWSVTFARWVPWVRTLLPLVAGAVNMRKKTFNIGSILGSIFWSPILVSIGFFTSNSLKNFEKINSYLTYFLVGGLILGAMIGIVLFSTELRKPKKEMILNKKNTDKKD